MLFIQLQEYAIPSLKIRTVISRQQRVQPEIRRCQNDPIFNGFSDFQEKVEFGFFGFLDSEYPDVLDFWKKMAKLQGFLVLFKFSKIYWIFEFLISGFLDSLVISWKRKG